MVRTKADVLERRRRRYLGRLATKTMGTVLRYSTDRTRLVAGILPSHVPHDTPLLALVACLGLTQIWLGGERESK
jgi:hypothetical protein